MFQGILIFAIGGLLLIAAFAVLVGRRRRYEESGSPEDQLTDAEFRRIEFGDEEL